MQDFYFFFKPRSKTQTSILTPGGVQRNKNFNASSTSLKFKDIIRHNFILNNIFISKYQCYKSTMQAAM